jgi:hypothetical protein
MCNMTTKRVKRNSKSKTENAPGMTIADLEKAIADINAAVADLGANVSHNSTGVSHGGTKNTKVGRAGPARREVPIDSQYGGGHATSGGHGVTALPLVQLNSPVILSVTGMVDSFTVTWSAVANAYSYTVQYSKDPTFSTGSQTGIVNAPLTSYTVPGREPDTTYYVRVKSYPNLPGDDTASNYSGAQAVRTLLAMPGEVPEGDAASQLQSWLGSLHSMNTIVFHNLPQLGQATLSPGERRRRLGSGMRRYGFIDKVSDTATQYPQFWPSDIPNMEVLKAKLREIEVLRNLLVLFRWCARVVEDRFLIVSDEAFRLANAYYMSVRGAARRQSPEAEQVFQMIQSFWKRPRRSSDEPTMTEMEHKFNAVMHGRMDGEVAVFNESDKVIKGKRVFIDKTRRKPRGGVKVIEKEEVDVSSMDAEALECEKGK